MTNYKRNIKLLSTCAVLSLFSMHQSWSSESKSHTSRTYFTSYQRVVADNLFEQAAQQFEQGDFTSALKSFLNPQLISDTRVPYYINHLISKKKIDTTGFNQNLINQHIENITLDYIPKIGDSAQYLRLSLLTCDLKNEIKQNKIKNIKKQIMQISSSCKIGHGYWVLAEFEKSKIKDTKDKKLLKQIFNYYEKGAQLAHVASLTAMVDFNKEQQLKQPIELTYINEYEVLTKGFDFNNFSLSSVNRNTISKEMLMSSLYNGNNSNYPKFKQDPYRKTLWQIESIRKGNPNTILAYAQYSKDELEIRNCYYYAAIAGDLLAQLTILRGLYNGENGFKKNKQKFINIALEFIENYRRTDKSLLNESLNLGYQSTLAQMANYYENINDFDNSFKWLKISADESENPDILYQVACRSYNSNGCKQDNDLIQNYLKKAIIKNSSKAHNLMGFLKLTGEAGVTKNVGEAIFHMNTAAQQGSLEAAYNLALYYAHTVPNLSEDEYQHPINNELSDQYLRKSAKGGYGKAQKVWFLRHFNKRINLNQEDGQFFIQCSRVQEENSDSLKLLHSILLYEGYRDLIPKDEREGLSIIRDFAGKGFEEAYYLLGAIYEQGSDLIEQNYDKAREYYELAPNHDLAINNLGVFYEKGKGRTLRDIYKARDLYQHVYDLGHGIAAYNLGTLYDLYPTLYKSAVLPDATIKNAEQLAFYYFNSGHERGDIDASFCYAASLNKGIGCTKNIEKAREIYIAIAPYNQNAQYNLAVLQIRENYIDSLQVLHTLAEQGFPTAQFVWGLNLYKSDKTRKDGLKYLQLAANQDFPEAIQALRFLSQRQTIQLDRSLQAKVSNMLMEGDIEQARNIRNQSVNLKEEKKRRDTKHDKLDKEKLHKEINLEIDKQTQSQKKKARQAQRIEQFLNDPNPSIDNLREIIAKQRDCGDEVQSRNASGSGRSFQIGNQYISTHVPHGSIADHLDPGRRGDYRAIVQRLHDHNQNDNGNRNNNSFLSHDEEEK